MATLANADLAKKKKKSEKQLHPHAIDLDFITTEVVAGAAHCAYFHAHNASPLALISGRS